LEDDKKAQKKNGHIDSSRFHFLTPDYDRPLYEFPQDVKKSIMEKLNLIYDKEKAERCFKEIDRLLKVYYAHKSPEMIEWEKKFNPHNRFTEKDIILITYGDLITEEGELPLRTLTDMCDNYLEGVINTLHILPFFPYSSDRGFAVMDFEQVDPNLGTWDDIADLKKDFRLMFDAVFNHVSSYSGWFQEFLNQNPDYTDFFESFLSEDAIPPEQLKLLTRPRTSSVLSQFSTLSGKRFVWTTFSKDQIDLNYKNPKVLTMMIDILLYYVRRGADILRLDAATYLWTQLGTSSANLPQTHDLIKLFRDILDAAAPHVALITETNIPHEENIKYFGNGNDEAQMVYNFALPPLVLHAFYTGNSSKLTDWASSLEKISNTATYFNFLDSHDGVSLQGARNILTKDDMEIIEKKAVEHGGLISYMDNGDGTLSPYEVDITWFSAINREDSKESIDFKVKRFLASRSIALVMMGIPGIYIHGLLGSKNDTEAILEGKSARSINRRTLKKDALIAALSDQNSTTFRISSHYGYMIKKRINERAFHPNAAQKVLEISDYLFTLMRTSVDGKEHIVAITNITDKKQFVGFDTRSVGIKAGSWCDVLSNKSFKSHQGRLSFDMEPYEVLWLKAQIQSDKDRI
jgi:glucosylglycerate phosphorylase